MEPTSHCTVEKACVTGEVPHLDAASLQILRNELREGKPRPLSKLCNQSSDMVHGELDVEDPTAGEDETGTSSIPSCLVGSNFCLDKFIKI